MEWIVYNKLFALFLLIQMRKKDVKENDDKM